MAAEAVSAQTLIWQAGAGPFAWPATVVAGMVLLYFLLNALYGRKRLPGPLFSFPVFGDSIFLTTMGPSKFLFNRYKRYGGVFRLPMLGFEACVVTDVEALRPLLGDDGGILDIPVEPFSQLTRLIEFDFQNKKEAHGPWRKGYLASVTGRGLQAMVPAVLAVMESHLDRWAKAGRMDLYQSSRLLGIDLGVDVIAGIKLDEAKVDPKWFKDQLAVFLTGLFGLPIALPGSALSKALAAKQRLLRVIELVVRPEYDAVLAELKAADGSAAKLATKYSESEEKATAVKATLLAFQVIKRTTPSDAAMAVIFSLVAAIDTTRAALFNTWALVAMSPRVQEQLYEEQKRVVAEFGPELSYKAAMSMPYMDVTIKESMRLFPASGGGLRRLTRELRVGDITLPTGTLVWYYPQILHTLDPNLWDGDTTCDLPTHMDWRHNFEQAFRPERWLSEDTRPKYYFTFGSGSHLCVGQNLVMMEIKLLLAMVVRKYVLELETPDMLARCPRVFPFIVPAKGTDGMRLIPREAPLV